MDLNNLINKIGIKQKEENKVLDAYIENKNREKLETLLSEFKEIVSDKAALRLWKNRGVDEYYNYINKKIKDFDFDIRKVNLLTDNLLLYQINDITKNNDNVTTKFGLFLSALINKNLKAREKVQITAFMPIDYLFYKLENAKAHVNIAGMNLGTGAKNSRIYADEAKDYAGLYMENCELHVKKAGDYLGDNAKDSRIYANETGNFPGWDMQECELHVRKAGEYLGDGATKSRIYADYTGSHAGWDMNRSKLHVRKAGDYLGDRVIKSKIYADEAGTNAGKDMENSELFIYKLDGKLYRGCLKGENRIYLGRESYYEHYLRYKLTGVKVWEKKT